MDIAFRLNNKIFANHITTHIRFAYLPSTHLQIPVWSVIWSATVLLYNPQKQGQCSVKLTNDCNDLRNSLSSLNIHGT